MPPKKSRKYVRKFPVCTRSNSKLICLPPEKVDGLTDDEDFDDAELGEIEVADVAGQLVVDDDEDDTLNEELTNPMWTKDQWWAVFLTKRLRVPFFCRFFVVKRDGNETAVHENGTKRNGKLKKRNDNKSKEIKKIKWEKD